MNSTVGTHRAGEETDAPNATRLNLGAGEDYRDGWHNVDYNERYSPDTVVDLREDWPTAWEDAFEHVLASHVFEHLPDLEHAFSQAAACLRRGGTLEVRVPLGVNAQTDWTHQQTFTYDTPLQFAVDWEDHTDDYQFDPTVPLVLVERELDMVVHGPLKPLSPLVQRAADTMPGVWTSGFPCASGELRAVYRRVER